MRKIRKHDKRNKNEKKIYNLQRNSDKSIFCNI